MNEDGAGRVAASRAQPMSAPLSPSPRALALWRRAERRFDAAFGSACNPLRQLGALGFLAFWLLAVTGVYLYTGLETSVSGAWESIERLSREQPYFGGVLRSMHRYAAGAFVVFTVLHIVREWLHGHYRGFRRYSWLTGVPLVPLLFASAIGGFWLQWDQLGQFSAIATAELLDALPLLGAALARNFLTDAAVSDRLFSLLIFVHVGLPVLLVFGLWFHVQRITRAAVFPPLVLAAGSVAALVTLSIVAPVTSHPRADLASVPVALELDWLLLFVHPLTYATSPGFVWALTAAVFVALLALPFVSRRARAPVAVVDPANCNGCRRCFADCPYAAITMLPHPSGRTGRQLALVDADLCAGCGVCAGACPSSTPFRSVAELSTGIDMPQLAIGALRRQLLQGIEAMPTPHPIVVFACRHGADVGTLAAPDVLVLPLICAGQLPPSFVEYALRDGAAGVVVATCRDGGCEFRLGARWAAERLAGAREPHLRADVPRERVHLVAADAGEHARLEAAVQGMRKCLPQINAPVGPAPKIHHG